MACVCTNAGPISMSQIKASLASPSNSLRIYSTGTGRAVPDGMSEFLNVAYGTLCETYCSDVNKIGRYCDGVGGYYDATIQLDSPDCGYVAPPPYIPPPPPPPPAVNFSDHSLSSSNTPGCETGTPLCNCVVTDIYYTLSGLYTGATLCTSHDAYACTDFAPAGDYSDGSTIYTNPSPSGYIDNSYPCPSPPPPPPYVPPPPPPEEEGLPGFDCENDGNGNTSCVGGYQYETYGECFDNCDGAVQ